MERTTAIFHARDRMDEAVRELEEQVGPERVHTEADPAPRVERPPRALFGMPFSVHYAGMGAAIGMIVGLMVSGAPGGASPLTTIWLVIVFAGLGALLGTFVGTAVGGFRKARWKDRATAHRFVLRVEVETAAEHAAVTRTITSYGGELTPA
jgi:hypothetical protein